ncbi:hypothetical protein YC2023_082741 [Brassica napus]
MRTLKHHSRWAGFLADFLPTNSVVMLLSPAKFGWIISIASGYHQTPAHSTKQPAFANPETVFVRKQCCNNPVNHRVFERKLRPKPSGRGHVCLGVTNRRPPILSRISDGSWSPVCYRTRRFGPKALDDPKSSMRPQSGEASSATDRAQVPWKGAPERVRAPSCPDPVAPRGAVYESGTLSHHEALSTSWIVWECSSNRARVKECLKLSGGKRMGAGDASRSDAEQSNLVRRSIRGVDRRGLRWRCAPVGCGTEQFCPPIDSGSGPTWIKVVTRRDLTALIVLVPSEVSLRIAGARKRVLSGWSGCFVEPSHGIESSKWAIFGKQNWRCGMNWKLGYGAQLRANLEPTKGVGRLRQQDGGHGSRNLLRSV